MKRHQDICEVGEAFVAKQAILNTHTYLGMYVHLATTQQYQRSA